jgi:tetratricopeptide (TPR) repeat protein
MAQLTASVVLNPDQAEAHAEMGQVYMEMGKYPEAETELNRAIALNATSYSANFALLKLYARTGDPRRAEQSKLFEAIRNNNQEQYTEAMRIVEARPETAAMSHQ